MLSSIWAAAGSKAAPSRPGAMAWGGGSSQPKSSAPPPSWNVGPVVPAASALGAASAKASPMMRPPVNDEPGAKRFKMEEPAVKLNYGARELRRALAGLGAIEALKDRRAVPEMALAVRDGYIPELDARATFTHFAEVFGKAKTVGHKKALVFVVHELFDFMAKHCAFTQDNGTIAGWRRCCSEAFLIPIGKEVKVMRSESREVFCKLVQTWGRSSRWPADEMRQLRDAWDMMD